MKEKNLLEAQLRSWTPRRPSPKLEAKLFPRAAKHFALPKLITVLAPVTACVVVTLASWRQMQTPMLAVEEGRTALVALSLSNQSYAPYLPGNCQSTANRWDTFEWTNRGYSQSSVRSFTPQQATDLE